MLKLLILIALGALVYGVLSSSGSVLNRVARKKDRASGKRQLDKDAREIEDAEFRDIEE